MSHTEIVKVVSDVWSGSRARDALFTAALTALGMSVGQFDRLLREARKQEGRFPKAFVLAPISHGRRG